MDITKILCYCLDMCSEHGSEDYNDVRSVNDSIYCSDGNNNDDDIWKVANKCNAVGIWGDISGILILVWYLAFLVVWKKLM